MDFNEGYLTYEEYKALGGTLDLMPFNLLEYEARRNIDNRTQNRLKNATDIPQEVKLCEYALINSIYKYSNEKHKENIGNITSESIDGYSVSFMTLADIQEVVKSKKSELANIIREYLVEVTYNDEKLLFPGV